MVQNWPYFQLFFRQYTPGKCLLRDYRTKKRLSFVQKQEIKKSRKIGLFSKGVNLWFWSRNGRFPPFLKGNIGQKNVFYDIKEEKNAFLGYKNKKFKRSKHPHFSKVVNSWFWSKNDPVSNFVFLSNIRQENVFYEIQEQIKRSSMLYNKKFKKSKNRHFFKGVNPWFWSTNGRFSNCYFLGNIGQENIFYDIVHRKNAFVAYENKKFKKSKNRHFSKRVNP